MPLKTSPVKDAATGRIGYITEDHHHRDRYQGAAADLGAAERQEE
jgi:hypothetical protein